MTASFFTIDAATGVLKFLNSPDYELKQAYDITVNASAGSKTAAKQVTVLVTNLNDNVPNFSSGTTGSVHERKDISTVIYDATAVDADGDSVAYSVSGTDSNDVEINTQTGEVTLRAPAVYNDKTSYTFTIEASDGKFSKTQVITVNVVNVNEAPTITSSPTSTITENLSTDVIAYQASASDPDGDALTYTISGEDAASFTIDANSGAVKFITSPDF